MLTGVAMYVAQGGFSADSPAAAPTRLPTADPSVPVAASPAPSVPPVCRTLLAKLPRDLGGRPSRPVTGSPPGVAAWGNPPVILRCGVPPVQVPPDTNKQFDINGVRWYAEARGSAVVFTTTDRTVPVQVTVPATTSGNPADVVADLSRPVGTTIAVSG